jgi:hypothetical protein
MSRSRSLNIKPISPSPDSRVYECFFFLVNFVSTFQTLPEKIAQTTLSPEHNYSRRGNLDWVSDETELSKKSVREG